MSTSERKGRSHLDPARLPNVIFTSDHVARNLDLTTENKRLCQHIDRVTKNSNPVPTEKPSRAPKRELKKCIRCCKQTVHKCKVKPQIVCYDCQPCDKDSATNDSHRNDRCANILTPAVSKDWPHETPGQAVKQTYALKWNVNRTSLTELHPNGMVELFTHTTELASQTDGQHFHLPTNVNTDK